MRQCGELFGEGIGVYGHVSARGAWLLLGRVRGEAPGDHGRPDRAQTRGAPERGHRARAGRGLGFVAVLVRRGVHEAAAVAAGSIRDTPLVAMPPVFAPTLTATGAVGVAPWSGTARRCRTAPRRLASVPSCCCRRADRWRPSGPRCAIRSRSPAGSRRGCRTPAAQRRGRRVVLIAVQFAWPCLSTLPLPSPTTLAAWRALSPPPCRLAATPGKSAWAPRKTSPAPPAH